MEAGHSLSCEHITRARYTRALVTISKISKMAKLMERNNSSAGCDVQTILEEIESLRSRLRKATADLYAVQGKSSVEEGNFEQNVDPLLQRNEHLAQQLAETQDKLYINLIPYIRAVLLI